MSWTRHSSLMLIEGHAIPSLTMFSLRGQGLACVVRAAVKTHERNGRTPWKLMPRIIAIFRGCFEYFGDFE